MSDILRKSFNKGFNDAWDKEEARKAEEAENRAFCAKRDAREKAKKIFQTIGVSILLSPIGTFILMSIWNYFAPGFNLPLINFWEAWALKIGVRMLTRGIIIPSVLR